MQFFLKAESSCKSIGYTTAAARANRRLMFAMSDMYGIPPIFFTLTPDDLNSFRVRMWMNSQKSLDMLSLFSSDEDCVQDFLLQKDA